MHCRFVSSRFFSFVLVVGFVLGLFLVVVVVVPFASFFPFVSGKM